MSVPNQTPYITYNANGLTTVFPFEFYIINAGDIQVSLNGEVTTTGYSVSGVGNIGGGDVTFLTPPANGTVVMLERVVPTYRLTDYQDNGDLLADTVNKDFDRLWMAIQRGFIYLGLALRRPLFGGPFDAEGYRIANLADPVNEQDAATKKWVQQVGQTNFNRTIRVPEDYVNPLAPAEQRRNRLQAYNNEGQPIFVLPGDGTASEVLIDLASSEDGKGDALVAVKQPFPGSVARTQHALNADYVNVKDWGALGDGTGAPLSTIFSTLTAAQAVYPLVTDLSTPIDTAAIDAACASLTGTSFVTNFRRLYLPHGAYTYTGTGIVLPNGTSLIGEDLFTTIDASANTNTGYLITLTGFRSRVDTIALKGNKDNPGMKGIWSYYNSDNGGVLNCILEDFHIGLDIDKCWYSVYRDIRFRRSSPSVVLTEAHIRLGFNYPAEEVNNIDFRNIALSENQKNGVAVYCPTQTLSWNGCSFETIGEARVKFFNTSTVNSFCLNHCYIEGGIGSGGVYLVEGQTPNQFIVCNDCTFRLGSTSGSLGKNITIQINGGWTNSPQVYLNQNNAKVWFSRYRYSAGSWADGPNMSATGLWDGANSNNAAIYLDPRPVEIRDWNSVIPDYVNTKKFITNASTFEIYSAYIPAGNNPRIMRLILDATHKREVGTDQYNTQWVIAITLQESSSGAGVLMSRVFENGTANAGAGTLTLSCVSNGYDSATDSIKYTISLTAATIGTSLTVLRGAYLHEGALSTLTPKWRIQRK